jgi:hypothetical protein
MTLPRWLLLRHRPKLPKPAVRPTQTMGMVLRLRSSSELGLKARSEEQMEFEKFLSKYNRRCKALTLGYLYLHEATMAQAI